MNIKKTFNELNKYIVKKETKNFSKIILDQAIVSGGNFFTTLILFKFLGLEDFGIFTAIWILIMSTNTVQESLIVSPLLSIAPKLKLKQRNEYISNLKFLQFIFSSFTSLIILIILFFAQNTLKLQNVDVFLLINIFISIPLIQYGEFCRRAIYISSSVEHLTLIDLSKYLTQITLFIISFNLGFKSE